ncbi:4411_t:CDS:1, partial [Paraglomus occultum]
MQLDTLMPSLQLSQSIEQSQVILPPSYSPYYYYIVPYEQAYISDPSTQIQYTYNEHNIQQSVYQPQNQHFLEKEQQIEQQSQLMHMSAHHFRQQNSNQIGQPEYKQPQANFAEIQDLHTHLP